MKKESSRFTSVLVWGFVFFCNLIFKLLFIDQSPLSYDEIISVKDTLLDFGHIKHESEWDTNPPLYYYALWIWSKAFGIGEFSVRAMSAFFSSIACVVFARYLLRYRNFQTAVVFILIFLVHPTLLFYAQEARCYSFLIFLCSISLILFHNFIEQNNFKSTLFLAMIDFLLFYTHYLSFLILAIQFIYILVYNREKIWRITFCFMMVLFLVAIRFTKKQILLILGVSTDSIKETWIQKATVSDLINFYEFGYVQPVLYLIFVTLFISLFYSKWKLEFKQEILIVYIFLISILAPLILFLIGTQIPVFISRYVLFSVPFSLMLFAFTIGKLNRLGWVLFIPLMLSEIKELNFGQSKGMDYRNVARFVKKLEHRPKVILYRKDITGLFTYYYDNEMFKKLHVTNTFDLNKKNIFDASNLEDFEKLDVEKDSVVLLFQTFDNSKTNTDIYDFFKNKGFYLKKYTLFEGVKFILFTRS